MRSELGAHQGCVLRSGSSPTIAQWVSEAFRSLKISLVVTVPGLLERTAC